MAANTTPDPATRAITKHLTDNPGPHTLEAIALAANVSKPVADKVLKQLTTATPPQAAVSGTGAKRTWTRAAAAPIEKKTSTGPAPAARSTQAKAAEAVSPEADNAPARDTEAPQPATDTEVGTATAAGEDSGAAAEPAERDADQMVMHAARTLSATAQAMTTGQIAAAGYVSATSLHLLTALRALAHHGLITCSRPFNPQDPDCTWNWSGPDPTDLLNRAAKVQPTDAPDQATCPECGTVTAIPGMPKPRKPGSGLRGNGTTKMAKNQLSDLVKAFIEHPDNAGESYKINDVVIELRAEHGDRISKHSYGSVSKALAKLTEPGGKDQTALLTLESESPLTYRVRALS